MGIIGTIGSIAGVVGGIGKELFGGDLEGERTNRKNALLRVLSKLRGEAQGDALKRNAGLLENSRQAAARRAGAQGRDAESFVLPVERQAMQIGNENLRQTMQPFRQAELNIEQDFANRPIEENFGQKLFGALGSVGSAVSGYDQNREYLDILGKANDEDFNYVDPKEIIRRRRLGSRLFQNDEDSFLGQ